MLRLSFIVPFYNVEPYIEECIRSLYNQDIPQEEYEVICVDDCSPDGSRAIVERLQGEYSTLKLICHTENKRQGGARNTGIREAKGKYVWFVDSDDYIKPNCLKGLLEQAEADDLDILQFFYNKDGVQPQNMMDYGICTGSQYVFDAPLNEPPLLRCCVVWRSLINREFLITNNIWFAENVQYEDDDYAYQMFASANRLRLISESIYYLRTRQDSTTHQRYSLQIASFYVSQVKRFINIEPRLRKSDKRWTALIREIVQWTCREAILGNMRALPNVDQQNFYKEKMGRITGLFRCVPTMIWLSMRFYSCYYKLFNSKNEANF